MKYPTDNLARRGQKMALSATTTTVCDIDKRYRSCFEESHVKSVHDKKLVSSVGQVPVGEKLILESLKSISDRQNI
jgi:hypothetical protein